MKEEEEEIDLERIDEKDTIGEKDPGFGKWMNFTKASVKTLRIVLKLADFADTSKLDDMSDDDAEFEDCEIDEDEGVDDGQVVDLDQFRENCTKAVI